MWIISKHGFVSIVRHAQDPEKFRVRARRREYLAELWPEYTDRIIDFGPNANDYRWHLDVPRVHVVDTMTEAILDIDYDSHVKEAVADNHPEMYGPMLETWRAFYDLQDD